MIESSCDRIEEIVFHHPVAASFGYSGGATTTNNTFSHNFLNGNDDDYPAESLDREINFDHNIGF